MRREERGEGGRREEEEEAPLAWLLKFHDLIAAAFKDSSPAR